MVFMMRRAFASQMLKPLAIFPVRSTFPETETSNMTCTCILAPIICNYSSFLIAVGEKDESRIIVHVGVCGS